MRPRWPIGLLLAATALTFAVTLSYQFVFDDLLQIVQNPRIQSWHFLPSYFTADVWAHDTETIHRYYRPLFLLELRLLHAAFGLWTPGWHIALVLCHLAAVLSVYYVVLQWKNWQTAILAAALFALHPVHAEVVSWASAIGEPAMVAVLLACLILFLRPGRWNVAGASALFAIALLIKETAVVWSVIVFFAIYNGLGRTIRRTLPLWIITLLYLSARYAALGGAAGPSASQGPQSLALVPTAMAKYFLHLIWPVGLSEFYFLQPSWAYVALVVPVIAGLIWLALRGQYERTAVLILLLPLLPVLNLKLMNAEFLFQDRYVYLPSVGFVMLLAPLLERAPKPALAALLIVMAVGSIRESKTWRDSEHLYSRALELSPTDQRARDGLARAYARQGQYMKAIAILEPLVQEAQPSARRLQQSLMTLAYSHEHQGHLEQALRYYTAANDLYPNPEIQQHLADLRTALAWQQLHSAPGR